MAHDCASTLSLCTGMSNLAAALEFAKDQFLNAPTLTDTQRQENAIKENERFQQEREQLIQKQNLEQHNHDLWLSNVVTQQLLTNLSTMASNNLAVATALAHNPTSNDLDIRKNLIQSNTLNQIINYARTNTIPS